MLRRFRGRRVHLLGLIAALLWAFTVSAGQVHRILVAHAVCEEHHEIVESRTSASRDPDEGAQRHGPSARVADPHGKHGCEVGVLAPSGPPPAVVVHRVALRVLGPAEQIVRAHPPRGPPLEYAPKTSPPAVG